MVYKIRLKAREKQAECSSILFLSFFVTVLTVLSLGLIPLVYTSAIRPLISFENKAVPLALSFVLLLISVIVYSALSLGCDRFMLKRAENTVAGAGDIFYYFAPAKTLSMCRFSVLFVIRKFFIFALLSVPYAICGGICYSLCVRGFSAAVCSIFAVFTLLFFILAVVTFSRICDTYFLVKYKYIKGDYLNMRQLFSDSQSSMMPKIKRLRKMKISFTGWFLLCAFIVPIPYVWSYYRQSKACFATEDGKL